MLFYNYTMIENYTFLRNESQFLKFLYFRQVVVSAKCLFRRKVELVILSVRLSVRRQNVRSAKCLSARCLSAKCLGTDRALSNVLLTTLFTVENNVTQPAIMNIARLFFAVF